MAETPRGLDREAGVAGWVRIRNEIRILSLSRSGDLGQTAMSRVEVSFLIPAQQAPARKALWHSLRVLIIDNLVVG
jgi:hypothetical protein